MLAHEHADHLRERLRRPLYDSAGAIWVDRILEECNARPADVARALGVRVQQVYGWAAASPVLPSTAGARELFGQLARVVSLLRDLVPDDDSTGTDTALQRRQLWLQNPQAALRGERPIDLVLAGRGAEVADLLWLVLTGQSSL